MTRLDEIINQYDRIINLNRNQIESLIRQIVPVIKEGFIEFYGEEAREKVEDKFNRVYITIPLLDIESYYHFILMEEIKKYMQLKYPNEYEFFRDVYDNDVCDNKTKEYKDEIEEIKRRVLIYKENSDKFKEKKEALYDKVRKIKEIEFNKYIKDILIKELNFPRELVENTNYKLSVSDPIYNFFSENKSGEITSPYELSRKVTALRDLGIEIPTMEWELKDNDEWTDDEFKNAKEEYNALINDDNIKIHIPSPDIAKSVMITIIKMFNQCDLEVNTTISEENSIRFNPPVRIMGFEGVSLDDAQHYGAFAPYLTEKDGIIDVGGIITASAKGLVSIEDFGFILIHELNHLYEAYYFDTERETYILASGWDFIYERDKITHSFIDEDCNLDLYRENELMSEVINNKISEKIWEIIRKQTNNIAFNKRRVVEYNKAYFILDEFYETYEAEIIESRKKNNMEILYQRVGKVNCEALASLMRTVSKQLYSGDIDFDNAMKSLKNGVENDETKFLVNIMQQRDLILTNMKEYASLSNKSRGIININNIIIIVICAINIIFIMSLLINLL